MIGNGDKMKKIKDKSFWLILSLSILTLIILTVGVIFLTRKSSKEFYSAGYIINSTATKSDKYYFNDNTTYKENVFNEYTFKDVDNKEVTTSKENFIHYLDESLSFMKNGVILDLDNFNQKLVPYYNVTDKVILKYSNGGYIVETAEKTLVFGNLLGRITDNKYIVLGNDIRIKLAGNEEPVKGKYFELLFVEDGIVKVENNEGSYQTTTEGTTIFVGDKIKIELGSKKVFYGEEEKLTLDEMTINGNENINLDTSKVKDDNKGGNGTDGNTPNDNKPNDNTNQGNNTENPNDNTGNGTDGDNTTTEVRKEVSVDLVKALLDINSLNATIQVIDTANQIKGNLLLTLYDIDNSNTAYTKVLLTSSDLQEIAVNSLSPNTNYYMSIKDSDGYEYLARNFRTDNLELSLKREMVTKNSVIYSVDFSSNDNVKSAKVSLYDSNNKLINHHTFINGEDESFEFNGLTKNTSYKVVLDEVLFKNTNYSKVYTINTSVQTLKEKPSLGAVNVKSNEESKTFELTMEKPIDEDKSISNYIYKIYDLDAIDGENIDSLTPVYTFSTVSLKNEVLKLGENNLQSNKNYVYKVTARYYDNYKENEIDSVLSGPFIIAGLPSVTIGAKEVDFNSMHLLLTLKDEGCTIPGRSCYQGDPSDTSDIYITYKGADDKESKYINNITFDPETLTYDLKITGLMQNKDYKFEVWGNYDLYNGKGLQVNKPLGTAIIQTAGLENLTMSEWTLNNYSNEQPISVNTKLTATKPSSTIIDKLNSFKINLYKGSEAKEENLIGSYDVEGNTNIKSNYYNKSFNINSKQFGITDINSLREISGGKLNRYYTIEVTDAYDAEKTNKFRIQDNTFIYEIPAILLLEEEVSSPEVIVEEITKKQALSGEYGDFNNLGINKNLSPNTVVGYKVTANFDKKKVESYFQGDNPIKELNFYANMDGKVIEKKTINFAEEENYTIYFFLKDGTDYNTVDTELRRGNNYAFSIDLSLDTNNDKEIDTNYPSKKPTSETITSIKEEPKIKMYIDSSTSNSITYKYIVVDYDNALVKEEDKYLIHYTVGDSEEEYTTEISNTASMESFTISNLTNETIYNLYYNKALNKKEKPSAISFNYYFDGYHNASEYGLGYTLEYRDFVNEITLRLNNNDFLDRVSAYLVTLTSGSLKYEEVITTPLECGTEEEPSKCIKIDYANINDFKGKDVTVKLEAFYDTGYVGFGSKSLLGDYFTSRGLIDDKNASNVGFILQEIGNTKGKYYYIYKNSNNKIESVISEVPKGILGISSTLYSEAYKQSQIHITNVVDITNKKFINYDEVSLDTNVDILTNGIKLNSHNITIAPKLLDKTEIQTTNNKFKFTSIIPKVKTINVRELINGAILDIDLSIDTDTLETDYVKTDGKYKFYIDIYSKDEEGNRIPARDPVETDYEHLTDISFAGLNPDSKYYYTISADMNKNGQKVKTPLFYNDEKNPGYVEFEGSLKTLGKDDIFRRLESSYKSQRGETVYSERILKITAHLNSRINFDIRYELYDPEGNLEKWGGTVLNKDITNKNAAVLNIDITGDDFVFGNDYHRLVITAVTTDAEPKELELYNGPLNLAALAKPSIEVNQKTGIDSDSNGNYDYFIEYDTITIIDTNRVIKDGKVYVELEDSTYENACPNGEDCRVELDLYNNVCNPSGTHGRVASCYFKEVGAKNTFSVVIKYNKLNPDTNYFIYASADIYRNNVSESVKEDNVYVRKGQYTRSKLGFSLGSPTLTAKGNTLTLTFVGAANINNNSNSIKGIEYNVNEEGAGKISSGKMGLIPSESSTLVKDAISYGDIEYKYDTTDKYYYIEIPIPEGKKLGTTNFIVITYYYEENGHLVKLSLNGNTNHQYYVKDVS